MYSMLKIQRKAKVIETARKKEIMLSFKYIYLSLALGLKNKHCFPRQHVRELEPSLDHCLVQAKKKGFTFYY